MKVHVDVHVEYHLNKLYQCLLVNFLLKVFYKLISFML